MPIKVRRDGRHQVDERPQAGLPGEAVTARPRQAEADQAGQRDWRQPGIGRIGLLDMPAQGGAESLFLVLVEQAELMGLDRQHAGAVGNKSLLSGAFGEVREVLSITCCP